MIVAPLYRGDDMDLALLQHGVYTEAAWAIVNTCQDIKETSIAIAGKQVNGQTWERVMSFDLNHFRHILDILAAAWRYEVSPPQPLLPLFPVWKTVVPMYNTPMKRWLWWLRDEIVSWVNPIRSRSAHGPEKIRLVLTMLEHQYMEKGYRAERSLRELVIEPFKDIPWNDRIHTHYGISLDDYI